MPPHSTHLQVTDRQRSYLEGSASLGRYELRPANTVAACPEIPTDRTRLLRMMADHRFGIDEVPTQYKAGSIDHALSELSLPDAWLSASLRVANRRLGAAFIFKGLDLREGWIVPRVTASGHDVTGELLFTPSASRWADYYFSAGVRRQYVTRRESRTIETEQGPQTLTVLVPPSWNIVVETGVKFRAELPRKMRPFVFGYSFGGLRFGIQALGFSRVEQFRFIWEIGAGAW
jgi:hypothetical protein